MKQLDEGLLLSQSRLRLWRTVADEHMYSPDEDGDCDVCDSYIQMFVIITNVYYADIP